MISLKSNGYYRFEKLDLRLRGSRARSIGTIVSITGALIVTLYEGLPISIASLPEKVVSGELLSPLHSNWILGGFCSASAYFLLAVTYIVQVKVKNTQTNPYQKKYHMPF